ncbi:hypothetical protein MF271_01200 (plasmid) [Deinococcus sp. KNUC1210]|uniref:hypothetical protein n=1 Tax=Deinococcus sp. KNUC1210 TaxID=2917691 RepID=UPI001EF01419|nr:hypothetical protein [Deinococcus sp. KNUC1210]ULH14074.1 hypothetical protein MF271_01200 [Deinococcus sp. KNUC1210]
MTLVTALYDAGVLYPSLIRNLLVHLATSGLVAARWTEQIQEEWSRNLLQDRPELTPERLARTRRLMDAAVPDALVEDDQALIELERFEQVGLIQTAEALASPSNYRIT